MLMAALRATSQDSVQPVYLTHFVIYVTPDTYEALKASPLIREELGGFRESTTQAEGGALTYTRLNLSGMHTYMEIFKAGYSEISHKVEMPGRISITMWVDHRSQLPVLAARLPMLQLRTRRDAQNQPWYDYINEDLAEAEGVTSWVAGNYPDGMVRSVQRYDSDRLLHDFVACTVTVQVPEREKLVRNYRAYGYDIQEDESRAIATGPDFILTALPDRPGQPRTASIEMTLNRAKSGGQDYRIGEAELQFAGKRATLRFHFPPMELK
jgi:Family of unknown function (DUF5829)